MAQLEVSTVGRTRGIGRRCVGGDVKSSEEQELRQMLKQLLHKIRKDVEEGLSRGRVVPFERVYRRWKVDGFEYGEAGAAKFSVSAEGIPKAYWVGAGFELSNRIKESSEYSTALGFLTRLFGGGDRTSGALYRLTLRLILGFLNAPDLDDEAFESLVTAFLNDLREKPVKCRADVELNGIVILSPSIEIKVGDTSVTLRQTTAKDLEKEFPMDSLDLFPPRFETFSAVLVIEFPGRAATDALVRIEQAVTLLRLFKVGSIKWVSCRLHAESFTGLDSGSLASGEPHDSAEKYVVTEKGVKELTSFWQSMIEILPRAFYDPSEMRLDHLAIAYKRYCDALLNDGIFERRIANAVMGLESLFLKSEENLELSYRLATRIAKVFGLLGHDPHAVREALRSAYRIRSIFVHGGSLSHKDKRKLGQNFGDPTSLLGLLLNYVRMSLITWLYVRREKEELLDLIDDSLVDKNKESQLDSLLGTVKSLFTSPP